MPNYARAIGISEDVCGDIEVERWRQERKHGHQTHDPATWLVILGEEYGEVCNALLGAKFKGEGLGHYRAELVQVAAVAIAALECLDQQRANARSVAEGHPNG